MISMVESDQRMPITMDILHVTLSDHSQTCNRSSLQPGSCHSSLTSLINERGIGSSGQIHFEMGLYDG